MAYEYIQVDEKDGVLLITMDDPRTRNAMGGEMMEEINTELDRLESDSTLRVVVLTGKDPAFCSGANVRRFSANIEERERQGQTSNEPDLPSPWERMEARWGPNGAGGDRSKFLPLRIHNLQKPSIAMVNGPAMGLGMGMMVCQMFGYHSFSEEAWGMLGIGGAATWKMGIDRDKPDPK